MPAFTRVNRTKPSGNSWTFIPGVAYRKILPEANIELTGIWDMEFDTGDPATNYDNGILSVGASRTASASAVSQPQRPTGFPVYNQPRFLK